MEKENLPLVSIITPTLNSAAYIEDNIESIASQTYRRIEHLIIDGVSSDGTLDIVKKKNPQAIILSEKDRGISDAFNRGLAAATGDIIAILNSDDFYENNTVIEKVVNAFISNPACKIIYGRVRAINPGTGETLVLYGEPFSKAKLEKEIIIPHPAFFAMKEAYEKTGEFSLSYRICMDHDYFLRAADFYEPLYMDEVFTVMRLGGASTKNIYLAHREAYRIMRSRGSSIIVAGLNLLYRYIFTTASLGLQKTGLKKLVLTYRKRKGAL